MTSTSSIPTLWRRLRPQAYGPKKSDEALVDRIRSAARGLSKQNGKAVQRLMADLRRRVQSGTGVTSPEVLVRAFGLVAEVTRRELGIELYDVQLLAGLALARGNIAEMQTGEGKTYAALLPACLYALRGEGVHVMTVNAYLAQRDFKLLETVYRRLGFSVGLVESDAEPATKKGAYACDVTYGPGYDFGFDYLRDQVALISRRKLQLGDRFRDRLNNRAAEKAETMQRGQAAAIVDEADSVMIDEATTPLILASDASQPSSNAAVYLAALQAAADLEMDRDYVVNEASRSLQLTQRAIEHLASCPHPSAALRLDRPWPVYVEHALRAKLNFQRDAHYIVCDDKIWIVDQYTGRIFSDRTWREGLHQAVQAKEGLTITEETSPIARITRQRYFRLYSHLCGMTGTARDSLREFRDVYGLRTVAIPLHVACQRISLPMRVLGNRVDKERAIVDSIIEIHATRRPILVGTAAIEVSERLARMLDEHECHYRLLNGKQDADEASIVARAGEPGSITIATNMAGRGTDIRLSDGVSKLGGLHVIATEAQESARVDRQLAGRAGRQGDPGSCQLFVAADDQLFARYDSRLASRIRRAVSREREIEMDLTRQIAALQRRVQRQQSRQRQAAYAHDDWLESVLRDLRPST